MDTYINNQGWRVVIDKQAYIEGHITFHAWPTGSTCRLLRSEFFANFKLERTEPQIRSINHASLS